MSTKTSIFRIFSVLLIFVFILASADAAYATVSAMPNLSTNSAGTILFDRPLLTGFPDGPITVPDDIMPPIGTDLASGQGIAETSTSNYSVLPIMFVPSDLTPNPNGLRYIDQRMQLIQRWYAEQLRGRTFTLQPAIVVRGSFPLSYYYGDCYPPDNCNGGYNMWNNTFADLPALGYPYQSNLVRGVFFQNNGMGAPALGGGGNFLVALDADNNRINPDCLEPGCASSVAKGGAAHELGHAFGLPHTVDDPEGSPGFSLMSYGFYGFPQCTLVNTTLNLERDTLYASPFLNVQMSLADGGFEDCLTSWIVTSGMATCSSNIKHSGLNAMALSPSNGNNVQVRQQILATAQQIYDISAWINSPDAGNHHVWIQVVALDSNAQVLSNQIFGELLGATDGWQRVAYSLKTPALTTSLQILINASGSDAITIYADDVDVHESKLVPPVPLQMFYFDGDTVNGNQPTLSWDDATSATSFQVQVGVDSFFNPPLLEANVTSPFFLVTSGLSVGSRYFWRVRAANGTGASDWSSTWSFATAGQQDYFSDEFESMALNSSWSWIREDQANWHLGGPPGRRSFGYMGITVQAGDLLGGDNSAKNLLLKDPPQGNYEISTKIDFWETGPPVNYQQAGLIIYQDDNNYLKLVRAYSNGHKLEWLAEVNGVIVEDATIPIGANPPIRITQSGNQYSAKYSVDGITWNTLGSPVTVGWSSPKIGLAAFSKVNVQQITAYFDFFRVSVPPELFTDVPTTYWAWQYIERLYNAGITGGCLATPLSYCPDSTVTRAQMAVFLLKGMHGSSFTPPDVGTSTGFTDVSVGYWAAAWIKQLAAEGITGGCGSGNYCPDATVTRAQMAVFLLKVKHGSSYSPPTASGVFTDVPVGYWADKWIEQLAVEGVTSGCGIGIYCPDDSVTRAQMAVFLVKAFGLP